MATITRRDFSKRSLAILGGVAAWGTMGGMGSARAAEPGKGPVIGRIAPRSSKQIVASPFGVGFETLDRRLFDPEPTYERLERLGIKWARIQSGWCRCETTMGMYDFAWLDKIVDSLRDIGIQPWMNLTYGNKLYMPDAPNEYAMGWAPVTETARQGWIRFVRALTEHYRDRIRHWEIWNEPNLLWSPRGPSAVAYTELVKRTSPVIRASIPDAVVAGSERLHPPSPIEVIHPFRSKASSNSEGSHPVIPIESIHFSLWPRNCIGRGFDMTLDTSLNWPTKEVGHASRKTVHAKDPRSSAS